MQKTHTHTHTHAHTQDVMHKLSVPLEELYVGSTKKLALNRHIADNQGRVTKKKEVLEVCIECVLYKVS